MSKIKQGSLKYHWLIIVFFKPVDSFKFQLPGPVIGLELRALLDVESLVHREPLGLDQTLQSLDLKIDSDLRYPWLKSGLI
jgi:hypothetical protein